jgi:hypothetical protein
MGNCLSHPSDVRYSTIPAYGPPPERLQTSAHQQQSGLQAKAGAGLSSPRKPLGGTRDAHVADQCDGQQHGEEHQQQQAGQQQQQQPLQWHSPSTTGERSQHYGGSAAAAAGDGGQDAAPCGGYEDAEPPLDEEVPFSWTKGELLGAGAFGRVYTALNNANGRLVAVKQVSLAKDEALAGKVAEHIRALEAEVEVLKTLRHENIVRYLGTQRTDDALHIFLEYVSGGSIASLLTRFGPLKEPVIRLYTAQVRGGVGVRGGEPGEQQPGGWTGQQLRRRDTLAAPSQHSATATTNASGAAWPGVPSRARHHAPRHQGRKHPGRQHM